MDTKDKDTPPNKLAKDTFEIIWRNINIVLVAVFFYCVPSFYKFQYLANQKGYHFVTTKGWIICLVAFCIYGAIKKLYFALIAKKAYEIVHPKYQDEERTYRQQAIQKLSFDFFYYFSASTYAFIMFRKQYWFPKSLGGQGECHLIFKEYPNWPTNGNIPFYLEIFYMTQLGVYFYKIVESFLIRKKVYRKFYEFLLHHFMATALILFSILSNIVAVGTVILFLHDACDMASDVLRVWAQTKFRQKVLDVVLFLLAVGSWFYMRLIIFPTCAINALYSALPSENDEWIGIWFGQLFLVILCSILVVMHCYWLFYMMKGGYNMARGKALLNPHDRGTKVKKEN